MRHQEENEAIDTFVTALYALMEHWGYGSLHDEMIRDRIVLGIRNTGLLERLQLNPKFTLESAVTQVRQSATIKQQQAVLRGGARGPVGAVQSGRGGRKGKPFTGVNPGVNQGSQNSLTSRDNSKGCPRCGKFPFHDKGCHLQEVQQAKSLPGSMQICSQGGRRPVLTKARQQWYH